MGMAAILVMWPGPFDQTFVLLSHGDSIWNLTLIGQEVSEGRCLKSVNDDGRRTDNGAYIYFNLTYEPEDSGELKHTFIFFHWKLELTQFIPHCRNDVCCTSSVEN